MAAKSPTSLNTSRNRAIAIGTDGAKFAEPDMSGFRADDQVVVTPSNSTPPMSPVVPCSIKL